MTDGEQIVREVADRVRALVSEAEEKAARIIRDAEVEAKAIRERAESESAERLAAARSALDELQSKLGLGAEVEPGPVTTPEPEPPPVPEPAPPPPEQPEPTPEPEPPLIPEPTPPPDEGTPPQVADNGGRPGSKSDDAAGARLVAMNLALDGTSREEAKRRLAEQYDRADLDSIVDEVYAKVAG